jgi:hypothetical protein
VSSLAVFRFGDGTSRPVPESMLLSRVPINALFLGEPRD